MNEGREPLNLFDAVVGVILAVIIVGLMIFAVVKGWWAYP